MKVLIAYRTKYGTAASCARLLAERMAAAVNAFAPGV